MRIAVHLSGERFQISPHILHPRPKDPQAKHLTAFDRGNLSSRGPLEGLGGRRWQGEGLRGARAWQSVGLGWGVAPLPVRGRGGGGGRGSHQYWARTPPGPHRHSDTQPRPPGGHLCSGV